MNSRTRIFVAMAAVATAVLALAVAAYLWLTPSSDAATFDAASATLAAKLGKSRVTATKVGDGSKIVVIICDRHVAAAEDQSVELLREAQKAFGFRAVGVESFVESPKSQADVRVTKRLREMLDLRPELLLDAKGGGQARFGPDSHGHGALFTRSDLDAFGVEDEELLLRALPAAAIEHYLELISSGVRQGWTPVRMNGKWAGPFLEWKLAQEALVKHDPEFPVFDFEKLSPVAKQPGAIVAGPPDSDKFTEYETRFMPWFIKNACIARNRPIATKIADTLKQRGAARGALVIGAGHTLSFGKEFPSVQECLNELGYSTVVLTNTAAFTRP